MTITHSGPSTASQAYRGGLCVDAPDHSVEAAERAYSAAFIRFHRTRTHAAYQELRRACVARVRAYNEAAK